MTELRLPRGRGSALALAALVAAALWLGPLRMYADLVGSGASEMARQARLLQRYRALAGTAQDEPVAVGPRQFALLLPDAPEAQATALLQQSVKKAAAASRVELRSLSVLPDEDLAGARRIHLRIEAGSDMPGLARLLFAIASARPLLYADNLQVQARPAVGGKAFPTLDFGLEVSSFVRRGG